MMAEAEQAEALVVQAQTEPHGLIRMSCPTGLVEPISGLVNQFLERHPKVRLQLVAVDRPVDLIGERIDVALRVRTSLEGDASLTMRSLGNSVRILVASRRTASRIVGIDDLKKHPTLSSSDEPGDVDWYLETEAGQKHILTHTPRIGCADFSAVRAAAVAGLGVALLPDHSCRQALDEGKLIHVLPAWRGMQGLVHLVFTTRRGLPPAVRRFIDSLAAGFPKDSLAR